MSTANINISYNPPSIFNSKTPTWKNITFFVPVLPSQDKGLGPLNSLYLLLLTNLISWQPETTFEEGACAVLRTALAFDFDVTSVTECFNRVGLLHLPNACPTNGYGISCFPASPITPL